MISPNCSFSVTSLLCSIVRSNLGSHQGPPTAQLISSAPGSACSPAETSYLIRLPQSTATRHDSMVKHKASYWSAKSHKRLEIGGKMAEEAAAGRI